MDAYPVDAALAVFDFPVRESTQNTPHVALSGQKEERLVNQFPPSFHCDCSCEALR